MMKPAERRKNGRSSWERFLFKTPNFPSHRMSRQSSRKKGGSLRRSFLVQQISSPVRWVECTEELKRAGCDKNDRVWLRACSRRSGWEKIDSENIQTFNINSLDDLKSLESSISLKAVGRLEFCETLCPLKLTSQKGFCHRRQSRYWRWHRQIRRSLWCSRGPFLYLTARRCGERDQRPSR